MITTMARQWLGRSTTSTVLAGLVFLAGAGCADNKQKATHTAPATTAAPSPTENAEVIQARAGALAAYNGYRNAHIAASAKADASSRDLAKYAAGPLLSETRYALTVMRDQGLITIGKPTWDPKVTTVNVTARPFSVHIEDCFDGTNWNTVYKDTKKSAAVKGQAKRYLTTADVTMYDDGRWLVRQAKAHRDRPC